MKTILEEIKSAAIIVLTIGCFAVFFTAKYEVEEISKISSEKSAVLKKQNEAIIKQKEEIAQLKKEIKKGNDTVKLLTVQIDSLERENQVLYQSVNREVSFQEALGKAWEAL